MPRLKRWKPWGIGRWTDNPNPQYGPETTARITALLAHGNTPEYLEARKMAHDEAFSEGGF